MKTFPYLAIFLGAVLIGMSPVYVRLSELGPVATAFYRVAVSVPFFLLMEYYVSLNYSKTSRANKDSGSSVAVNPGSNSAVLTLNDWLWLAGLGFTYSLNLITWHLSLEYIYIAKSTLLANLGVIFVIPLGWLFFGKKMNSIAWLYALGALGGVFLLVGGKGGGGENNLAGIVFGILAAILYALYILIASKLRERLNTTKQMLWTGIFTSLFVLPFIFLFGETMLISTVYGLLILLGLGITSQVIGQGFIAYSLAYIAPNVATLILLLQPIVAILMGWLIFSESLTYVQLLGAVIIMLFIYLTKSSQRAAL